ncbi:MAG: ABC transporter ATP-binding protein [Bacillota bacterium]|nr:ABC transporter ATP-binding protein [Bacillota bacterium]HHU61052.1 ABC transporter ATP-binding protein [Natronincola sp.]
MTDILNVRGVTKSFPGFILDNISFYLPKGYIMGLVGPNGAGKTTTIQLILNILRADSGKIELFGLDNKEYEVRIKQDIGVVFDTSFFADGWKVKDVEKALSPFYDNWNKKHFADLIDRFELPRNKKIEKFSRGMQMKLMLSCALAHDAKLLILDEPTSGLDAVARDQLSEILQDYIKDGERSVLFSTHITSDLQRIADYITFINRGKLFYTGSLDGLVEKYSLIKGKPTELDDCLKDQMLGFRVTNVGFEGLAETSTITKTQSLILEPASLDDIILFASKKGANQ